MLMTDKKEKIRRLFNETFADKARVAWFFSRVYRDDRAMLLEQDGAVLSSLMMRPYRFLFHDSELGLAFIHGVATARAARGHGYMSQLMTQALHEAADSGMAFAAVIPSARSLYFFYDRFGFANAVYYDLQRYTSVHAFPVSRRYEPCPVDYDGFARLERRMACTVLHSEEDYTYIIERFELDHGTAAAVRDVENGGIAAMAFAVPRSGETHVEVLYAVDRDAADNVLSLVHSNRPMAVHAFPETGREVIVEEDTATVEAQNLPGAPIVEEPKPQQMICPEGREQLRPRAMLRIIDAMTVLTALAQAHPELEQVIRLHDSIIPANNGVFILRHGKCTRTDFTMRHLTLDVDIAVLTSLLFSSQRVGEVFSLPTVRPALPLMLD